jgi:hypothetical protein
MSDDYTDSSSDSVLRPAGGEGWEAEDLRIAVHARGPEEVAAFRRELEKRFGRKSKTLQRALVDPDANIAIHLLTDADFADGRSTMETMGRLAAGVASRNVMLEPVIGEIQARRRMTETLSDFARRPGFVRLALEKEAEDPAALARHQARAIAKLLLKTPESPEGTPAADKKDRAAHKAEKRAERTTKRAQKKSEKAKADSAIAPAGRMQKKEEKRAAKAARGSEGKREKKNKKERAADDQALVPSETMTPEARAAKRAARKAEKGKSEVTAAKKRKKARSDSGEAVVAGDEGRQARKAAKAARKAEGKGSRRKDGDSEEDSHGVSISIAGLSDAAGAALHRELAQKLATVGLDLAEPERKCDVAVYGFETAPIGAGEIGQRLAVLADDNARARIFLERISSSSEDFTEQNHVIAKLAAASGGSLLRLGSKLRRYGDGIMVKNGQITDDGQALIADLILGVLAEDLPKHDIKRPLSAAPSDLAEAQAQAGSPSELLGQLLWEEPVAPKLLWTHVSKEAMEALIDEKLTLSSGAELALRAPIAWPEEISDRATSIQILGLEFLTGPLSYWYSKASGRGGKQLAEIDVLLKDRGVKASEILSRAERAMLDFAAHYPADAASDAWREKAVSRRVRVLMLYVLCCRMALKRHIRFDADAFTRIFRNLLDLIELLRADDFYKPASIEGFEQDCLLVGLGLALRGTAYGNRLLEESLERLRTLQLDLGFTADGVWRVGSFSDHCGLLSTFRTLMGDFGKLDAALIEPFAAAAKKMTVFAEAVLKSNGQPPLFDNGKQKSFASQLSGTRRALAQASGKSIDKSKLASMPRIADTYVFRDAQYFISHSTQKVLDESSLVLLHADSPNFIEGDPGGVTLAFAYGEADLLRRAEAPELEKKKDKSPLFDPALRNGYHVDGAGFDGESRIVPNAARIVKSWRGPGWAAARSIDEINPAAAVTRVAIHLKAVHALIVVDALETRQGGDAVFEQFWHIAPGLAARPGIKGTLRFGSPDGGMNVAFDANDTVSVEAEGEGVRISRSRSLSKACMATLFQWTRSSEAAAIAIFRQENSGWSLTASGAEFAIRLVLSGDELRYEESKGG